MSFFLNSGWEDKYNGTIFGEHGLLGRGFFSFLDSEQRRSFAKHKHNKKQHCDTHVPDNDLYRQQQVRNEQDAREYWKKTYGFDPYDVGMQVDDFWHFDY